MNTTSDSDLDVEIATNEAIAAPDPKLRQKFLIELFKVEEKLERQLTSMEIEILKEFGRLALSLIICELQYEILPGEKGKAQMREIIKLSKDIDFLNYLPKKHRLALEFVASSFSILLKNEAFR